MTAPAGSAIDVRASAMAVLAALKDLQGYLTTAVNPDRLGLEELGIDKLLGWTERMYSPKAFEIWRAQLKLFPDDPQILHHLAIMLHARAFDLEATSGQADADWKAALDCWSRLQRMDAYWDSLTAKATAGTTRQDSVKALRAELAQKLLAIHYDLALDGETRQKKKSRAKFHIALAQSAPFDAEQRSEAQRAAYGRYIKAVPDEVWQPNELREDVLAQGQNAIVEYLNFDPGCVPALEDALRLQRRVQRSRNTAWQAMGQNDPKRRMLLLLEKKDADAWRPFFNQLAVVAGTLQDEVREDLAHWYYGRGGDLQGLEEHEKAIEFYEQAVALCRPDDDIRRRFLSNLVMTYASVAREKASGKAGGALAWCDKVRARTDLNMGACCMLAQAYAALGSIDVAVKLCDRGIAIEPDFDDLQADEWLQRLKDARTQIPIGALMSRGRAAMEAGKFQDALVPLTEAEQAAKAAGALKGHNSIYWLRAQAYLALDRFADAKKDTDLYVGLLDGNSAPSDIAAGKRLQGLVAEKEQMNSIKPLLDKATAAMKAERFADALPPLDEAAKRNPKALSVFFLRAQGYMGAGKLEEAQKDAQKCEELAESDHDQKQAKELLVLIKERGPQILAGPLLKKASELMKEGKFLDALPLLHDAARKAPRVDSVFFLRAQANAAVGNLIDARSDAGTVRSLATTSQDRETAGKLEEMVNNAESARAFRGLMDEAQRALKSGSYAVALRALNEAAAESPGTPLIYFLRAQANAAIGNPYDASLDADRFSRLASSPEERAAAAQLSAALGNMF